MELVQKHQGFDGSTLILGRSKAASSVKIELTLVEMEPYCIHSVNLKTKEMVLLL
jgi:hypothetical protein